MASLNTNGTPKTQPKVVVRHTGPHIEVSNYDDDAVTEELSLEVD